MAASLADPPLALSSAFSGGYISSSSSSSNNANDAAVAIPVSESDFDYDYLPPASRYQLFERFGEVRLAGRYG